MLKKWPILMMMMLAVGMASAVTLDIPEYLFVEQDLEGCYLLKDKYDLYWFANKVNTENTTYATACAKLTADIVVNEHVLDNGQGTQCVSSTGSYNKCGDYYESLYTWTPIGTSSSKPFQGTFDGLGHTISGLYDGRGTSYTGLFGYVSGTNAKVSIKNVGVKDSYFRVTSYAGGIVGMVYDGSGVLNIENVYSASTFYIKGEGYVGGLIGRVGADWTLNITNAYNSGSIFGTSGTTTTDYVAGLVGHISGSASVNIKNAFNNGNLNGYAPLVNSNASVQNSYYLGDAAQGSYGENKSASDFSDGTVLNLLKDGENGFVWQSGSPNPTLLINSHKADLVYLGDAVSRGLIYFIEGFGYAKSLPTIHLDGSPILGWYENQSFTGTKYTEIPADVKRDLQLYPKLYKPVDDCYEISDADELYAYASIVNGTLAEERAAEPTACGKLTANIVVNENVLTDEQGNSKVNSDGSYNGTAPVNVWTPIGTSSTSAFKGSFNGKGHTISGLYFNNSSADNVGLFGYTSGAVTIDGVGVVDSYFRGKDNVGGLVGYHYSTQSLMKLSVKNSYNAGFVTGTSKVGGLVGGNFRNLSIVVENSYNTGSVNGSENVGGLVGVNGDINYSYNTGSVTGTTYVGGLLGSGGKIIDCYNTGSVKEGNGAGNAMKGKGCVQTVSSDMNNSYYLEGSGNSCGPSSFSGTADEFANGYVALELHNNTTATGAGIWGQVVGADKTPVLTGEIVFPIALDNSDNCYVISSAEDLYVFAAIVNSGFKSDACGKLTENIVVNENVLGTGNANIDATTGAYTGSTTGLREWTPIGNSDHPFIGTFDGDGHTISGLYFNDYEKNNVGLFGYVESSESVDVSIKNVGLEDSYFKANGKVGGVVGLVGDNVDVKIENVYNAAVVTDGGSIGYVGGIVGEFWTYKPSTLNILNSYNSGAVFGNKSVGGLVGGVDGDDVVSSVSVKNCYNYGALSAFNNQGETLIGSVVGSKVSVNISDTYYLENSNLKSSNGGTEMSSDEFANGTVYAALHGAKDGEVWRQYKNDAYPTFAAKTGTGAPAPMHVAVLHYSETDSVVIAYTEGTAKSLPTEDNGGNPIAGWTTSADGSGNAITEIPTSATTDLKLYAKVETFKPNAEGFYEIATADDLYKFAEIVNGGNATAKAKLMNDIVVNQNVLKTAEGTSNVCENGAPNDCLDGAYIGADSASFRKWTPIGDNISGNQIPFKGSFDGQGHTISGLYLNKEIVSGNEYSALFGIVDGDEVSIKNVGIEDSYFAAQRYVGGIIGRSVAKMLEIENCYNAATLYGINGLGGLVGELNSSDNSLKIENSYNFGTIKYDTSTGGLPAQTGALVGQGQGKTEVLNSFYLEQGGVESDFGTAATSSAFANGTVATLLHGDGTGANSLWGQNVKGGESHPTFFKGINVEVGPGVIAGGPETSTITLSYPDVTDSSFTYVEGWGASLPEKDKNGDYVIWYDDSGNFCNEISSTVSGNLDLHAVVFKPDNDGFYDIDDVAKLYKFAAIVNGGNGDVNAKLSKDIEVNKNVLATAGGVSNVNTTTGAYIGSDSASFRKWTPIGSENNSFQGIFDGEAHKISGLYYNDEDAYDVGLFGYVKGDGSTIIKNVGIEDSYFKALDIAGGILGEYGGGNAASIENVYSAAVVVAGEDAWAGIGGVVGTAWNGDLTVTNAYNVGSVIGGSSMGGIVGYIEECSATIKNSFNYGNVAGDEPLVGFVDGDENVSVSNSYYLGDAANGGYGEYKSASDFENGTVLSKLREQSRVWVQNPSDKYPTIDIKASNTIVLDWTSADYSTTLADAGYTDGAMVIVKSGKQFYAGGAIYEGILSADQVAAIGGNKLYPISGVELETVGDKLVATLDGRDREEGGTAPAIMIPFDLVVDKVIYKRNLTTSFKTVMLPFEVPLTSVSGVTLYRFKRMAVENDSLKVKVSTVKEKFEANTPYIMMPSGTSNGIEFEVTNQKLTLNTTTGTRKSSYEYEGVTWTMNGVYEYKEWKMGDSEIGSAYLFAAQKRDGVRIGQFAKLGSGASLQPMRIYLVKEAGTPAQGVRGRVGEYRLADNYSLPESVGIEIEDGEEDETTVVNRAKVTPTVIKDNRWFDVKGRALNGKPTAKGTYYHNGQKVIIK